MNAIHNIVQQNASRLVERITRRYGRVVTSSLIGVAVFTIFFYTISDGFRESPTGALMGIIFMLAVTTLAWRRYRQATTHDYNVTLKGQLQQLIAQTRQNLVEEQLFVIGLPLLFLLLSQLLNGRFLSNLGEPNRLIGLAIMALFTVGLLFLIRRSYQSDIKQLQALLSQLDGE